MTGAINPERYIVPGSNSVYVPPAALRYLVGYAHVIQIHAKEHRGMNPEVDAVVDAIRIADLRSQRAVSGRNAQKVAPSPEPAASSPWYSTSDAAQRLRVTDRAIRNWCSSGRIPAARIAGRWHIAAEDLTAFRQHQT